MLYLLDANVLITANDYYYPIERVPEFWDWLQHMGALNHIKIPMEIIEEIKPGHKKVGGSGEKDPLYDWMQQTSTINSLKLEEEVNIELVQEVIEKGYASDLTDDEVEQLGRDPFLIAYAIAESDRCVVTTEVSKPSKQRQNRHLPDVCNTMNVQYCDPFTLYRKLDFRTSWHR